MLFEVFIKFSELFCKVFCSIAADYWLLIALVNITLGHLSPCYGSYILNITLHFIQLFIQLSYLMINVPDVFLVVINKNIKLLKVGQLLLDFLNLYLPLWLHNHWNIFKILKTGSISKLLIHICNQIPHLVNVKLLHVSDWNDETK